MSQVRRAPQRTGTLSHMRTRSRTSWLLVVLALSTAHVAVAVEPPSEDEVRALMNTLEAASRERNVAEVSAALAPDCRIELKTRIGADEHAERLTAAQYLELLKTGFAALSELESYVYEVTDRRILRSSGTATVTVVSHITEHVAYHGLRQTTHSEETARVERRGGTLQVVEVVSLTTGD